MGKLHFTHKTQPPALPLAALVDVLFLVIIFLILGAQFSSLEEILLPQGKGNPLSKEGGVSIEIRANGQAFWKGERLQKESFFTKKEKWKKEGIKRVMLFPHPELSSQALFEWHYFFSPSFEVGVALKPKEN